MLAKTQTQSQSHTPTDSLQDPSLEDEDHTKFLPFNKATVLVLGESQSGKSTFIRKLFEIAQQPPPPSLQSGDGVKATTLETTKYVIPLQIERWGLYRDNKEIDMRNTEFNKNKFFDLAYDSKLQIKPKLKKIPFELTLIDTPGLKGDDNAEAKNMNGMLRTLASVKQVNSVLFLEGGSNYGPVLKSTLQYYQNIIGRGSAFDVIHTKYSVDDHLQFLDDEIDKRILTEDGLPDGIPYDHAPLHPRHAKFYPEFSGWQHLFTDARPQKRFSFREWLTHSTIIKWVLTLSTKNPIPVHNLPFYKTDDMRKIDEILIVSNQAKLQGHLNGLTEKETGMTEALREMNELMKQITKLKVEIEVINQFLTEWDNKETVVMGSDTLDSEWKFWTGQRKELRVKDTKYPITTVVKAINASAKCRFDEKSETPYGEGKDIRSYSIAVESSFWRGIFAACTVFTFRKEVEREKIILKKEERIRKEGELQTLENEKTKQADKAVETKNAIEKLENLINRYNRANDNMKKPTMGFEFYDLLDELKIYDKLAEDRNEDNIEFLNDLYSQKYVYASVSPM